MKTRLIIAYKEKFPMYLSCHTNLVMWRVSIEDFTMEYIANPYLSICLGKIYIVNYYSWLF